MTYKLAEHFLNPKVLITTHTSSQTSSNAANTYTTISGTEISYTPASGSTSVIYDVSFYARGLNNVTFQAFYLEHYQNNTWSEINSRYRRNVGNSGGVNQAYRWFIHFQYVLPTWTGSRDFRLRCASNGSNRAMTFHQPSYWDGASTSTTFTNTNLLMYSI